MSDPVDDGPEHDFDEFDELETEFMRRRIKRNRGGSFTVNLPAEERELLTGLPAQLRELLGTGDQPSLRRLFPAAYHLDAEKDAEYQDLMRSDLLATKIARAELLESTAHAKELSEEQLLAWMGAVNDIRLVLGTQLDVSEDDDDIDEEDPRAAHFGLYHYLGYLLETIIRALS
jgi:Domain of unknown function (DUF2017)